LKRLGLRARASDLAEMSCRLFAESWAKRQCPENFNADTGLADDQPDTDTFYGWGGLMPMMGVAEAIDVTPWHGWEITNHPGEWSLGPLLAFGRPAELRASEGRLTLKLDGEAVLATTVPGRLRQVEIASDKFSCLLPDLIPEGTEICLPQLDPSQVKNAELAGSTLAPAAGLSNSGTLFRLPATAAGSVLVVTW
jgi:putative isomerase